MTALLSAIGLVAAFCLVLELAKGPKRDAAHIGYLLAVVVVVAVIVIGPRLWRYISN